MRNAIMICFLVIIFFCVFGAMNDKKPGSEKSQLLALAALFGFLTVIMCRYMA